MKNKIDLDKVAKIANWIRREQKANPEGIKNVFGGTDENTALALEALPKIVSVLQVLNYMNTPESEEYVVLQSDKKAIYEILQKFETPE